MRKSIAFALAMALAAAVLALPGCGKKSTTVTSSAPSNRKPPTRKVKVGDIDVAYRVYGKGYPIIFIMGYSGTQDVWDPNFINDVAKKYKVITFDNRGMGETTAGTREFTIKQFSDDTAGFMDALGISTGHVLGWSMGTNIAQELTLDYPDKVNKLVLYAADPGGQQMIQPSPEAMKTLTDTSGTPEQRDQRLVSILFPASWLAQKKNVDYLKETLGASTEPVPAESVQKQTAAMSGWQGSYDRLPNMKSLTLLATGTDDVITPPQNSLLMANRIPDAWLAQFRGGGHGMQYQYPRQFSAVVLDFLSAPDAPVSSSPSGSGPGY